MTQDYSLAPLSLLSLMVFTPLIGALALLFLPPGQSAATSSGHHDDHGGHVIGDPNFWSPARLVALVATLVTFAISAVIAVRFDPAVTEYQFRERVEWISSYGISYSLGLDGLSLVLVMLTTLLMPIVVLASGSVTRHVNGYLASMLALETAMLGTLAALDVFLFYVFWELMLAPMYFIIGIWGGKRRIYAAIKFVLYTVAGSVLMLVAIIYVVWAHAHQHGEITFALNRLVGDTTLSLREEILLFGAFALAFGIKVPIFPFHTWLPDAHVEAPTGGSVVLAGVLLKMGIYGFLRFAYPLFPRGAEQYAPILGAVAVIGIIYGALVAWAQTDIKKLVAYSSVSHLGYCVLGMVAFDQVATAGSIYQLLNHGISTGALFLLVGVLYDRRHTREIAEYGGLAAKVPVFAFLFLVFTLSSIALPLTNGFVGEFMILLGTYRVFPLLAALAVCGVILGAIYMLTLYMRTMFGEIDEVRNGTLTDCTPREVAMLAPLFVLVFVMGIYPQPILARIQPAVTTLVNTVQERHRALSGSEMARNGLRGRASGEISPARSEARRESRQPAAHRI